jgi:uridine kinase
MTDTPGIHALGRAHALDAVLAATSTPGRPVLVAVDGVDGSGKTTFATDLALAFEHSGRSVVVVHLDDFHQSRELRHRQGWDSPIGYVEDTTDLAAFRRCVLDPLDPFEAAGPRAITPKAFDHRTDLAVTTPPVAVPADGVVIIEGLFLHRDELVDRWDVSVFLDVPLALSVGRMALRDGSHPDPDHPSVRRYVEGQRLYQARCAPHTRATFVVDNG